MNVSTGRLTGTPMDFSAAAGAAIEAWATRRRPDARNFNWAGKAPTRDWGYDPFSWLREISEIHREFERLVGFSIPLPAVEKRKTADFTLLKTHFMLVRKAETKSGQTLLKTLVG